MDLNIPDRFFVSDAICDERTGLDPFGYPTQGFLEIEHHLMLFGDEIVYDYFHNWCTPSGMTCLNSLIPSSTTKESVNKSIERFKTIFRTILLREDSDPNMIGINIKPISLFELSPEDIASVIRRHRNKHLIARIKNKYKKLFGKGGLF